jgi:hypothetical protein
VSGTSEDKKRRIRGEQSKNVIAEAWLEPILNPVTGKAHRAIIEIPEGFESSRMDQASMKTLVANDGYLSFQILNMPLSNGLWYGFGRKII